MSTTSLPSPRRALAVLLATAALAVFLGCDSTHPVVTPDEVGTARLTVELTGSGDVAGVNVDVTHPPDVTFLCVDGGPCDARPVGGLAGAPFFAANGGEPGVVRLIGVLAPSESFAAPAEVFEIDFRFSGEPPTLADFALVAGSCDTSDILGRPVPTAECGLRSLTFP